MTRRPDAADNPVGVRPTGRTPVGLVLTTLFLGTFALGCGEMLVVGVLDLLARDLHVSVPAAGALMTASALGLAIGGPILTALTIKLDRRTVLLGSLAAFVLLTTVPVVIPDFRLFVIVRVATGALQGLFIAAAFLIGPSVVEPGSAGRAMSIVLAGFAVSSAAGVPIGTLIGHAVGWRGAFLAVIVLASVVFVVALAVTPSTSTGDTAAPGQTRHALAPRVLALLGLFFLVFAANSTVYTYVVPFLHDVTGVSGALVSAFLLAYGTASFAGSLGGGRLADGRAARTLVIGTIALVVALFGLWAVGSSPVLVAVVLVLWGLIAFGMTPSVQLRVVRLAGPGGALASSLPASAANAGLACGSVAGGVTIEVIGIRAVTLTGLGIAVAAALVAILTRSLDAPAAERRVAARRRV